MPRKADTMCPSSPSHGDRLFLPVLTLEKTSPDALRFPAREGELTITDLRKSFQFAIDAYGLPTCLVHDLLYTFASHTIQLMRDGHVPMT